MKGVSKLTKIIIIATLIISLFSQTVLAKAPRPSTSTRSSTTTRSSSGITTTKPSTSSGSTTTKSGSYSTTSKPSTSGSASQSNTGSSSTVVTTTKPSTSTGGSTTSNSSSSTSKPGTTGSDMKTNNYDSNSYNGNDYTSGGYNTGRNTYYNNYYYDNTGSRFNNLLSHYFLYRALTPNYRNEGVYGYNSIGYAPVYSGVKSILYDVVTFIVLILIIGFVIFRYKRRNARKNRLY